MTTKECRVNLFSTFLFEKLLNKETIFRNFFYKISKTLNVKEEIMSCLWVCTLKTNKLVISIKIKKKS